MNPKSNWEMTKQVLKIYWLIRNTTHPNIFNYKQVKLIIIVEDRGFFKKKEHDNYCKIYSEAISSVFLPFWRTIFYRFRIIDNLRPGLGIYKRKKENTQERKQELVQENTHENTQKRTRTRKRPRKQELVQENTHENTHSYKKASTQKRTRARKHVFSCTSSCFLSCVFSFFLL